MAGTNAEAAGVGAEALERFGAALKRGFQIREAELNLARLVGDSD